MCGMTMRLMLWSAVAVALPLAAAAEELPGAVTGCRTVADDAQRLACYDRAVDAAAAAAAAAGEPELSAEERFGRRGTMVREEHDERVQATEALGELHATVTEIWRRSDGLMRIALDNGQVWSQNRPDSMFRLKEGDRVRIAPASMGSFLMSGPSKRSTRVTRLQ